jgi:hypothetical protein
MSDLRTVILRTVESAGGVTNEELADRLHAAITEPEPEPLFLPGRDDLMLARSAIVSYIDAIERGNLTPRSDVLDTIIKAVLLALRWRPQIDPDDPALLERVALAIWDENSRNYDDEGKRLDVEARHRLMARAAIKVVARP